MKLNENTTYYFVKLTSAFSTQIRIEKIKIIKHKGECNVTPIQELTYLHHSNIAPQKALLSFENNEDILKEQNSHIYKISNRQALCLTIQDCKLFIRQFYKINNFTWWTPKSYGTISKLMYKNVLKQLDNYVRTA